METGILRRFGFLVVALLMLAVFAVPVDALDVAIINDVPSGHPRLKYALQIEADVAKASGGSIRVVTNRDIPGKAGLGALLTDKAQIAALNTAHLEAVDPRVGFVNLPFGLSDAAIMERPGTLDRIIALMQKQLDASGLVILGVMRGADNLFVFKNRRVREPGDLAGVKIRVTGEGIYEEIMKSLGAQPVAMPIGQIKEAIAQGKVEGTSTSPGGWTSQLGMSARMGSQVPGLMMLTYTYVAKKGWLDSLTTEQRDLITKAVRDNSTLQWRAMYDDDRAVIDAFVKQGGSYEVVPESELSAWRKAVAPVSAGFEKKYPDVVKAAREILEGK
jgi:C4-dicarboxylate-binding protein DctP